MYKNLFFISGCQLRTDRGRTRKNLLFAPTAAKSFDQLNRSNQSLAGKLGIGAFCREGVAAGVHDLDIGDNAGTIAVGGQFRGSPGAGHGALLGFRLDGKMVNPRKAVFHVAKGNQHLLTVEGNGFLKRRLRMLVIRPVASAREQGQRKAGADGPGAAVPTEQ
jgi:hypothetical protein